MAHSGDDEDASQTAAALTAAAGADDAGPMANAPALPAPSRASRSTVAIAGQQALKRREG